MYKVQRVRTEVNKLEWRVFIKSEGGISYPFYGGICECESWIRLKMEGRIENAD
jgi:hypothetical protein